MGFRFFKRVNILPGIYLNLSRSGISISFGITGAKTTISKKGIRKTFGLPGTGVFYVIHKSWKKKK